MKIAIVLKDAILDVLDLSKTFNIGVEKGCINIINNNLPLNVSIGDFDSVSLEELELIKQNSQKHIKLNSEKDYTDTYEAVKFAKTLSNDIIILGGILGNRIDHLYANINMLFAFDNLTIVGQNTVMFATNKNIDIKKDRYKYISLYAFEEVKKISLEGFKYNLTNYTLKPYDNMGTSNELVTDGKITFEKGKLLIVKSLE